MASERELLDRFSVHLDTNLGLSDATVRKYLGHLERLIIYTKKHGKSLLSIDQDGLEDFTGLYMHGLGLAPRSRQVVVSAVRKFYKWLDKNNLVKEDPARNISRPKAGRKLGVKMELDWMAKLIMAPGISSFIGLRDTTMISMLAGCGFRRSGIAALNQNDLIFTIEKEKEKLYIKVKEKGSKERIVPAPDECRVLTRAYLGHKGLDTFDRTLPDGDQVLFIKTCDRTIPITNFHGENLRLSPDRVNKIINSYGEQIGMPKSQRNPKALRHLYGTELTEDDVDPNVNMMLMGHEDPKSQQQYIHLARRKLRKAVEESNPLSKVNLGLISDLTNIQ